MVAAARKSGLQGPYTIWATPKAIKELKLENKHDVEIRAVGKSEGPAD